MSDFPVIKLTLAFVVGIISKLYIQSDILINFISLGILALILFTAYSFERKRSDFPVTSFIIYILVLLLGYTSANIELKSKSLLPDSIYVVQEITAYGEIEDINLPDQKGFSFLLKTDSLEAARKIKTGINILCMISDDNAVNLYNQISPGNKVKITGKYRKGREERNPGEFDYNKYLRSKSISGLVYCYDIKNISILSAESNVFLRLIFEARKAVNIIITGFHTPQTAALIKGLILADRSGISYETKNQFIRDRF